MGSVGAPEILVILVVALLVLGPDRLPGAVRQVGRVVSELRRMSSGFQAELRDAMNVAVVDPTIDPAPVVAEATAPAPAPGAPPGPTPEVEPLVAPPPGARPAATDADGDVVA